MRTRSNRRTSWFEPPPSFASSSDRTSDTQSERPPRTQRRRRSDNQPSSPNEAPTQAPIQPAHQAYPTMPSAPLLSSDAVLRNVALVAVIATFALLFLNAALYVAVVTTAVLIPAWRTFKSLELPPASVEIIEIDGDVVELPPSSSSLASTQADELQNLHKYWIMAAFLFAAHSFLFTPFLSAVVPDTVYHSAVLWTLVWLNANRAGNAAHAYNSYIQPALVRSEHTIDVCVQSVLGHVDAITRHLIVGVNQAVGPYARQLEHAAAATRREMEHARGIPRDYFN